MNLWEKSIQFHGHHCCVLAVGYRAGMYAKELLAQPGNNTKMFALVETADCSTDAVQVVLRCTTGNRRLIVKEQGKHVFTVSNSEKAVRMALKPNVLGSYGDALLELMTKVANGEANEDQRKNFFDRQDPLMEYILKAPAEELFTIRYISPTTLETSHDFHILVCEKCNEGVAAIFAKNKHGKHLCQSCM